MRLSINATPSAACVVREPGPKETQAFHPEHKLPFSLANLPYCSRLELGFPTTDCGARVCDRTRSCNLSHSRRLYFQTELSKNEAKLSRTAEMARSHIGYHFFSQRDIFFCPKSLKCRCFITKDFLKIMSSTTFLFTPRRYIKNEEDRKQACTLLSSGTSTDSTSESS